MQLAEQARRPVLTFIDTPGAYPGLGAEERGQAEAIGRSIEVMAGLRVPIVCTVIGEGGSGGALAIGVANHVLMFESGATGHEPRTRPSSFGYWRTTPSSLG